MIVAFFKFFLHLCEGGSGNWKGTGNREWEARSWKRMVGMELKWEVGRGWGVVYGSRRLDGE